MKTIYKLLSAAVVGLMTMEMRAEFFHPVMLIPPLIQFLALPVLIYVIIRAHQKTKVIKSFIAASACYILSFLISFFVTFMVERFIAVSPKFLDLIAFAIPFLLLQPIGWFLIFRKQKKIALYLTILSMTYPLLFFLRRWI